jgi:hypothetical protein
MTVSAAMSAVLSVTQTGTNIPGVGRGNMLGYMRILVLCTLGGYLFATVFLTPGGAMAGAVKGLLVGILVGWAEWKSTRRKSEPVGEVRVF